MSESLDTGGQFRGVKFIIGTAKSGHLRGSDQLRGVVTLEGFELLINV